MSLWTLDGKLIVNAKGQLIECDHCPCEPSSESSESSRIPCSGAPGLSLVLYYIATEWIDDEPKCSIIPSSCATAKGSIATTVETPNVTSYGYEISVEVSQSQGCSDSVGDVPAGTYGCVEGQSAPCLLRIDEVCATGAFSIRDDEPYIHLFQGSGLETRLITLYPTTKKIDDLDCTNTTLSTATYILKVDINPPDEGQSAEQ